MGTQDETVLLSIQIFMLKLVDKKIFTILRLFLCVLILTYDDHDYLVKYCMYLFSERERFGIGCSYWSNTVGEK